MMVSVQRLGEGFVLRGGGFTAGEDVLADAFANLVKGTNDCEMISQPRALQQCAQFRAAKGVRRAHGQG